MSDTPETDEFERSECDGNESSLSFARKLERERDEAVRSCHIWQDGHSAIVAERDSNQRQVDALVDQLGAIQERMIDAERERDILRKHTSIMDISHKTANDEYFKLAVGNENLERERDLWKAEAERWRDCEKP